jgi:hypothetical protein
MNERPLPFLLRLNKEALANVLELPTVAEEIHKAKWRRLILMVVRSQVTKANSKWTEDARREGRGDRASEGGGEEGQTFMT